MNSFEAIWATQKVALLPLQAKALSCARKSANEGIVECISRYV